MLKTVYGIATEEGIYKLYQGFSAIICRHSIYTGSRVTLYRTFKEDVLNYSRMEKVPIYVGLGCEYLTYLSIVSQMSIHIPLKTI